MTTVPPAHSAGPSNKPIPSPVIVAQGLTKTYGATIALKGIDFTVNQGEIFGLIGPDGAGKTSVFHILGGVMEPTSGVVKVLDLSLGKHG